MNPSKAIVGVTGLGALVILILSAMQKPQYQTCTVVYNGEGIQRVQTCTAAEIKLLELAKEKGLKPENCEFVRGLPGEEKISCTYPLVDPGRQSEFGFYKDPATGRLGNCLINGQLDWCAQ